MLLHHHKKTISPILTPPPQKASAYEVTPPPKKSTTPLKTSTPKNGRSKETSSTQVYTPKVDSSNFGGSKTRSLTSNSLIVIGSCSNGPKASSTSTRRSKASTFTSTSPKSTTLGTIGGKKVSKGKKVATLEIVDIDYSVVEDMKKTRSNIYIFELSKISS